MKKLFAIIIGMIPFISLFGKNTMPEIDRIEPPYWWVGMQEDTLQLMIYGTDISRCEAHIDYPGVTLIEQVKLESPDYLFLYLHIGKSAKPGTLDIVLRHGKQSTTIPYSLRLRDADSSQHGGFDTGDVLYLIMPDRFARGANSDDDHARQSTLRHKTVIDRSNPNARHGGDIAGMKEKLDYIDELGVTAIWVNPVLTNDMPGGSYHGYATTDYYSIDPRFGTNDEWTDFVDSAHSRGLKVVMDMIFNHSGSEHPWFLNPPSHDWFNFPDAFEQTNYRLSTLYDPYVSDYDRTRTVDGWFVKSMPDLNQRNRHLMKYLIQNSIWWIETSKIDGIRMDTYPYADMAAMAQWIDAVEREYPNFNIVGECWYVNEGSEAYWQRGSFVNHDMDPRLQTVMDFVLSQKAREAFSSQTDSYQGINKIYDHIALDYLFPDPKRILVFLDNHDTDRFLLDVPADLGWWKQAIAFLLTSRGIPQLYYGTEILMSGSKEGSDGYVRRDMPGGFDGDNADVFIESGRTPEQQQAYAFMSKVLNWRRGNKAISDGTLKHFMPNNGLYLYERRHGGHQVIVMMNGNDTPLDVDMSRYVEVLPFGTVLTDILTGASVEITPMMSFAPRALYILDSQPDRNF